MHMQELFIHALPTAQLNQPLTKASSHIMGPLANCHGQSHIISMDREIKSTQKPRTHEKIWPVIWLSKRPLEINRSTKSLLVQSNTLTSQQFFSLIFLATLRTRQVSRPTHDLMYLCLWLRFKPKTHGNIKLDDKFGSCHLTLV